MSEPYLQSERHFRLYEEYIRLIIESWPNAVTFEPKPPVASVETLASRLRICIGALAANIQYSPQQWKVPFPINKFLDVYNDIVISLTARPGFVVCGPSIAVKTIAAHGRRPVSIVPDDNINKCAQGTAPSPVDQVIPKVHLTHPAADLVQAIIVLHHYRLLAEPSIIAVASESEATSLKDFTSKYDVSIVQNEDGSFTII